MEIGINYLFFLDYLNSRPIPENHFALDYGCGKGDFVLFANKKGYHFRGVDNYYNSDVIHRYQVSTAKKYIDLLKNHNLLPYSDFTFDFICSNQVFEHVENLSTALSEMTRVLKDGGRMFHVFPLKYCIIEPHYGIPFFSWFDANSRWRRIWTFCFYNLGFGFHRKKNKPFFIWYNEASRYIDKYCFYRTKKEVVGLCKTLNLTTSFQVKLQLIFHLSNRRGKVYKLLRTIISQIPDPLLRFVSYLRGSSPLEIVKSHSLKNQ